MSIRSDDHLAALDFCRHLETLSSMAFPAYGGGGAYEAPWWGSGTGLTVRLPSAQYDYLLEAGDLWRNAVVSIALGWMADNFCEPRWKVVETNAKGEDVEVPGHELHDLLNEPNPYYDLDALCQATLLSFAVSGNAYWIKVKDRTGFCREVYYVPHWEIQPRWNVDGKSFISRYDHIVDGERYPLAVEDVVHFRRGLDPRNVRSGLPCLDAILREIVTDNQSATYCSAMVRNLGVPGVVIQPEDPNGGFAPGEDRAFAQLWQEKTTGERVGEPILSSIRIKLQQLTATPDKMALDIIRRIPEARICAALKIKPTTLGLSVGEVQRSYANNSSDDQQSYRNCLVPLQKLFGRTWTKQLLPNRKGKPNQRVIPDYADVEAMAEDQTEKVKRLVLACGGPIITPNEGRAKLNMPPLPDGDKLRTQAAKPTQEGMPNGNQSAKPETQKSNWPPSESSAPATEMVRGSEVLREGSPAIPKDRGVDGSPDGTLHDQPAKRRDDALDRAGVDRTLELNAEGEQSLPFGLTDLNAARDLVYHVLGDRHDDWHAGNLTLAERHDLLHAMIETVRPEFRADAERLVADLLRALNATSDTDLIVLAGWGEAAKARILDWGNSLKAGARKVALAAAMLMGGPQAITSRDITHPTAIVATSLPLQSVTAAVTRVIEREEKYIDRFMGQIENGEQPPNGRVPARAEMYPDSGWGAGELTRQVLALADGLTEERSILDDIPHDECEECPEEAGKDWQPIGTLKPIGERKCQGGCRCKMEYRAGPGHEPKEPVVPTATPDPPTPAEPNAKTVTPPVEPAGNPPPPESDL